MSYTGIDLKTSLLVEELKNRGAIVRESNSDKITIDLQGKSTIIIIREDERK